MFGIGKLPGAPGTWGSAVAVAIWYGFNMLATQTVIIVATGLIFAIGVWVSSIVERREGIHDPSHVVIDEWAGQWIALWFVPMTPFYIFGAFLLFRVFDILKPWPVKYFDNMTGGWGIMLDDVAAGVYALVIIKGIQLIL